jgi:hypothetical protein
MLQFRQMKTLQKFASVHANVHGKRISVTTSDHLFRHVETAGTLKRA